MTLEERIEALEIEVKHLKERVLPTEIVCDDKGNLCATPTSSGPTYISLTSSCGNIVELNDLDRTPEN